MSLTLGLGARADGLDGDGSDPEALFGGTALANVATLDDTRGKNALDTVLGAMTASLSNSSATNTDVTASNAITTGSFANSHGLMTVVQNAADNVIIQTTTSVTVNFLP